MSRSDHQIPPELADVFEVHEPPSGGLRDLRARLEEGRTGWRWGVAVAVAVAVVVAFVLSRDGAGPTPVLVTEDVGWVSLGIAAVPAEPVTVPASAADEIAVVRIAVDDERVVLYRVASLRSVAQVGGDLDIAP